MNEDFGNLVRREREARKWSQEYLAKLSGTTQSTIDRIEAGLTRRSRTLPEVAAALGLPHPAAQNQPPSPLIPSDQLVGERDLPIFGSAEGGDGAVILSNEPVDAVKRPEPLARVRGGYGVIVTGESMIPLFRPGDIALINPHLPPRPDREVILQKEELGEHYAILKTLMRLNAEVYRLKQWNPVTEFTRERSEWPRCELVVGKYSSR